MGSKKEIRKKRIKDFWNMVNENGSNGLSKLHIKVLTYELSIVEEHYRYEGNAHKYLRGILPHLAMKTHIQTVKDQIAYRTILGEYSSEEEKD